MRKPDTLPNFITRYISGTAGTIQFESSAALSSGPTCEHLSYSWRYAPLQFVAKPAPDRSATRLTRGRPCGDSPVEFHRDGAALLCHRPGETNCGAPESTAEARRACLYPAAPAGGVVLQRTGAGTFSGESPGGLSVLALDSHTSTELPEVDPAQPEAILVIDCCTARTQCRR